MPIYEYQCKKCSHKFELLQKITDKPLRHCPQCKKGNLEKLVSNTSFQLKGTGWYVTDFRDKNSPKQEKSDDKKTTSAEDTTKQTKDASKKDDVNASKKETSKNTGNVTDKK